MAEEFDGKQAEAQDNVGEKPSTFTLSKPEQPSNPVLQKIKSIIKETHPEQWREVGEPLDEKKKYTRFVDRLEHGFMLELSQGRLFIRLSQRVSGQFFGGGYQYKMSAPPRYTVEHRSSNWNPKSVTESNLRFAAGSDESFQVLAEDRLAEEIYREVILNVRGHKLDCQKQFDEKAKLFLNRLGELIEVQQLNSWTKSVSPDGYELWYSALIEDFKVDLGRGTQGNRPAYKLILSSKEGYVRGLEGGLAQNFFNLVDTSGQKAGLQTLEELLSGAIKKS